MFSVGLELGSPKNANFDEPYVIFGKDCQLFTEQNLIRLVSSISLKFMQSTQKNSTERMNGRNQ